MTAHPNVNFMMTDGEGASFEHTDSVRQSPSPIAAIDYSVQQDISQAPAIAKTGAY